MRNRGASSEVTPVKFCGTQCDSILSTPSSSPHWAKEVSGESADTRGQVPPKPSLPWWSACGLSVSPPPSTLSFDDPGANSSSHSPELSRRMSWYLINWGPCFCVPWFTRALCRLFWRISGESGVKTRRVFVCSRSLFADEDKSAFFMSKLCMEPVVGNR